MSTSAAQKRIYWDQHQGTKFLMMDFSYANVSESLALMDDFEANIAGHPLGSVRLLTDVTGADYDPAVANKWKAVRLQKDAYVAASAIYGLSGLVGVAIRSFSELFDILGLSRGKKKLRIFKTREQALAWLSKV